MSANAAGRAKRNQAAANRHRHTEQPTREELQRQLDRLQRDNERLRKQLTDQQEQIADLERQLADRRKNSANSSKPPSSDGLAGGPSERKRKTAGKRKRKPGGQPGHPGWHRKLVAPGALRYAFGRAVWRLPRPPPR